MSRLDSLLQYRLPEVVEVTLPAGEVFRFRCPQSRAAIAEQQAHIQQIRDALDCPPSEWTPYLPIPPEAVSEIALLHLNYEGEDMSLLDWVRLQHEAGMVFSLLYQQYMLRVSEVLAKQTTVEIEQSKKN